MLREKYIVKKDIVINLWNNLPYVLPAYEQFILAIPDALYSHG